MNLTDPRTPRGLDRLLTRRDTEAVPIPRRTTATAATALAGAVIAASSATGVTHDRSDSGIKGRVVPCGIVLERPAACAATRSAASLAVGHGQRLLQTVKLRADGSFRVPLDSGSYWLQARTGKARGPRVPATVPDGEWITVAVVAGQVSPPAQR